VRVVWGIWWEGVFGKSVEREPFVATCLGVGRTLGDSFVSFSRFTCGLLLLFSFLPRFFIRYGYWQTLFLTISSLFQIYCLYTKCTFSPTKLNPISSIRYNKIIIPLKIYHLLPFLLLPPPLPTKHHHNYHTFIRQQTMSRSNTT